MTEREIIEATIALASTLPAPEYPRVETRGDLVRLIARISAGENCLRQLGGDESAEFSELCLEFNPDRITAAGRMRLGEDFMFTLGEDLKTPIKKYLQSLLLTARFVQRFPDVERFRKNYRARATSERAIIEMLEGFRQESNIFGMHLSKAADIMLLSHTLSIPRYAPEVKAFLQTQLNLAEENAPIYFRLMRICERTGLDPLHFSDAIYKLATKN